MTHQVEATRTARQRSGRHQNDTNRICNTSPTVVDTHLLIVVEGLPAGTDLLNASGTTSGGDPFLRLFLDDGVLNPGQDISPTLQLRGRPAFAAVSYHLTLLSGLGLP